MTDTEILALLREALETAAMMALPLLAAALITGLVVGLFQALTSIQEMTLTFVPKIAVMLVVFWVTASATAGLVLSFWERSVLAIVAGS